MCHLDLVPQRYSQAGGQVDGGAIDIYLHQFPVHNEGIPQTVFVVGETRGGYGVLNVVHLHMAH